MTNKNSKSYIDIELNEKWGTSTVKVAELRDTEQSILNYMLLSMRNFEYITSNLVESEFTFQTHAELFKYLCLMEDHFQKISDTTNFDIKQLNQLINTIAFFLDKEKLIKKDSVLNILSKSPSSNVKSDINTIKFYAEEKKFAIENQENNESIMEFNFTELNGYSKASFIQNKLYNVFTTNIEILPCELHDTVSETMKYICEIDLEDPSNSVSFKSDNIEPIRITSFEVKKNILLLEKEKRKDENDFTKLFEWANKYKLEEEVFPRDKQKLLLLEQLNISNMNIDELPKELSLLKKLHFLDISLNNIKSIPKEFSNLNNLICLILENNNIETIPEEIFTIKNLKFLILKSNSIHNISKNISNLKNLNHICLCNNKISNIPDDLLELTQLKHLCLHSNNVRSIPQNLIKLKSLEEFVISNNQIDTLPIFISKMHTLISLDMEHTIINKIPIELLKLPNLRRISFDDKHFSFIKEHINLLSNIDSVNLTESKLKNISDFFEKMSFSKEKELWLHKNDRDETGCIQLLNSKDINTEV